MQLLTRSVLLLSYNSSVFKREGVPEPHEQRHSEFPFGVEIWFLWVDDGGGVCPILYHSLILQDLQL